jgi:glycosyltransferase involved in cell wall biosynthesis
METITTSEKRPYITVLITAYNYGQFLEEAVDSVLAQDYPMEKVEILVIDDGSTDDTAERMKKYGPPVEYLYKPNGGQASALNYGFARARGEIVTLLDADDLYVPRKLKTIAEAFEKDPALGMVYHRVEIWYMDGGKREDWYFAEVSGDIHREPRKFVSYLTPPTQAICFRMSYLNLLLPIPEEIRMLADCYIAALIPYRAAVLAIPEALAIYRIHGANAHFTTGNQARLDPAKSKLGVWQIVVATMRKWLADNGYTRKQAPVGAMMDLWEIMLEQEEFKISAPGRVRFFLYLLKNYLHQAPMIGWRLALINHIDALGALVVGYKRFPDWVENREKVVSWVRGRGYGALH